MTTKPSEKQRNLAAWCGAKDAMSFNERQTIEPELQKDYDVAYDQRQHWLEQREVSE